MATASKVINTTRLGMHMRTLDSSLCHPRLIKDAIPATLPWYHKCKYLLLIWLDKSSSPCYFQLHVY